MAHTTFEIGEGATRLAFEANSWFASDVIVQLEMVLDRVEKINVKDLVDFRVAELMEKHQKEIARMNAIKDEMRKDRDRYYELSRK